MSGIFVPSSGGGGGTVAQGSAATLAGAWPVEVTDGTTKVGVTAGGEIKANAADGSIVTVGITTDVAVTSDANGTLSAKLRGIVKILADIWDSTNHFFKVSIQNATLAVTQSGTWTVQQGTPPWRVNANSGDLADGAVATLGTNADAAVGDATGTVNAHVRQVAKLLAGTLTTAISGTVDVADRAARLVGIVYGTLGQIVQRVASGTPLASSIAMTDNAVVVAESLQGALSADILYADINTSASGDTTIVAGVASKKIYVLGYHLVAAAAVTVEWKDGATTVIDGPMALAANGGLVEPNSKVPVFKTSTANNLVLNLGGAVQVGGRITYLQG